MKRRTKPPKRPSNREIRKTIDSKVKCVSLLVLIFCVSCVILAIPGVY